ncbi:MAG: hypothetical protein HMLKMBBP_00571 [Planctomycetes bacterium]|nr:hypothetical protein [Planctomycetota bacterium]
MGRFGAWVACAAAAVAGGLAGGAAAAIDQVGPGEGTVGTVLTITGSGFGTKKPKVSLSDFESPGFLPLKVLSFSDTEITAQVVPGRGKTAARGGLFAVLVSNKDAPEDFISEDTFRISVPLLDETSPATLAPRGTLTVTGSLFGTKKGKVLIGGKKAKVTQWTDTEILATAHKKTPAGTQDVTVENMIGQATFGDAVEVEEGDGGGGGKGDTFTGTMTGRIDGSPYADFRPRLEGEISDTGGITMIAGMRRGPVIFNVEVDANNLDLDAVGPLPGTTFTPNFIEVRTEDDSTVWRTAGAGTVTIFKVANGRYSGVLPNITMNRTSGTDGNPTLQINDFEFDFVVR